MGELAVSGIDNERITTAVKPHDSGADVPPALLEKIEGTSPIRGRVYPNYLEFTNVYGEPSSSEGCR